MSLITLGYDPVRGTIGATRLGDVIGPERPSGENRPVRKCAYVIVDDNGDVVGTCGTVLREGNRGCFCALHTEMRVKGEKYVRREAERRARTARKKMCLVRGDKT